MLPGGSRIYNLHNLAHVSWVVDLYYTDPALKTFHNGKARIIYSSSRSLPVRRVTHADFFFSSHGQHVLDHAYPIDRKKRKDLDPADPI